MSEENRRPLVHEVVTGETFRGHFATCPCGWSSGTPDEQGVSREEIARRVREHNREASSTVVGIEAES